MQITSSSSLDTTPGPGDWFTGVVYIKDEYGAAGALLGDPASID